MQAEKCSTMRQTEIQFDGKTIVVLRLGNKAKTRPGLYRNLGRRATGNGLFSACFASPQVAVGERYTFHRCDDLADALGSESQPLHGISASDDDDDAALAAQAARHESGELFSRGHQLGD